MAVKSISTIPKNDDSCGWIKQLPPRRSRPSLSGEQRADWVVLGAGYTGLAAARQLAVLHPQARVMLLEAERAGEGSSARNSGFLVDSTLNEGQYTASGIEEYRKKYELKHAGVESVQRLVADLEIDCDLEAAGKFHVTAVKAHEVKLQNFSKLLTELGLRHRMFEGEELHKRLGSSYYRMGLWTEGGVMLQPAKLVRGMVDQLPQQVELYENTPVLSWRKRGHAEGYQLSTPAGLVTGSYLTLYTFHQCFGWNSTSLSNCAVSPEGLITNKPCR